MGEFGATSWHGTDHAWDGWPLHPQELGSGHAQPPRPIRPPLPPNSEQLIPLTPVKSIMMGPEPPPSGSSEVLVVTACAPRPPPSHLHYVVPPRPQRDDLKVWLARKEERDEASARKRTGNKQLCFICAVLLSLPVLAHSLGSRTSAGCKKFNACVCRVWPNDAIELFCSLLLIALVRVVTFNTSRNHGQKLPAGITGVVPASLREKDAGVAERVSALWNSVNVLLVVFVSMAKLLTDGTHFTPLDVAPHPSGGFIVLPDKPPCSEDKDRMRILSRALLELVTSTAAPLLETTISATTTALPEVLEEAFAAATDGECSVFASPADIRSAAQLYFGWMAMASFMLGALAIGIGEALKLTFSDKFVAEDRIDISSLRVQSSVLEQSPAFRTMARDTKRIIAKINALQELRVVMAEETSRHLLHKEKSEIKAATVEIKVLVHELAEKAEGLCYITLKQMRQLVNTAHAWRLALSAIFQAFGFLLWLPSNYVLLAPCLGFDDDVNNRLFSIIPLPAGDTYFRILQYSGLGTIGLICMLCVASQYVPRIVDKVPLIIYASLACYVLLFMDLRPPLLSKHPWRSIWNIMRPANLIKVLIFLNVCEVLVRLLFAKTDCCTPSWLEQHQYDLEVEERVTALLDSIGDQAGGEKKIRKVVAQCTAEIAEAVTHVSHLRVIAGYTDVERPNWPPTDNLINPDGVEWQHMMSEPDDHDEHKKHKKQKKHKHKHKHKHHHHHHQHDEDDEDFGWHAEAPSPLAADLMELPPLPSSP
mmetsp:Transcript_137016/g.263338  ORF Transcript_137016/g.263338 Transcript_137016/m.263338 type:complete len:764 (+) Transcript_137016:69-2360(+)